MYEVIVYIGVCIKIVLINVWNNCINKMYEIIVLINVWNNGMYKMYEIFVLINVWRSCIYKCMYIGINKCMKKLY